MRPTRWIGTPGGDEAFARARREDKPIFLSVGYSTCHWCHVMERESFENDAIASALNDSFVSVKVDREERPDVDRVYMRFVQRTTGAGGWPMSVWLTPDLKPFYGGTYFPPFARWGRPGFSDILRDVAQAWSADRSRVTKSAESIMDRLSVVDSGSPPAAASAEAALAAGVDQFQEAFDARWGGFGDAPKFPRPSELLFLLREHARTGVGLPMVEASLRAMAAGGIRDHVGGGFHRYSVDAAWRVPHFEKMLYDQAQLVLAYLEGYQATGNGEFKAVALDTLAYVQREMTAEEGGFLSAEDADSLPPGGESEEKREGAFYVWTLAELERLLGDDADVVRLRFGAEAEGNAPEDPHGEFHAAEHPLHRAVDRRRGTAERTSGRRGRGGPGAGAANPAQSPRVSPAAQCGRQGAVRVERPHGGGVRAGGPGAEVRRRGGVAPRDGAGRRAVRAWRHVGRGTRPVAPALPRGTGGDRRLQRGLRLPRVGTAGTLPGRLRPRLARLGADPASDPGRSVLGCPGRRLVRHVRRGPVGLAQAEGRLRWRRAGRQLRLGAESPDPLAAHRRHGGGRSD